MTFSLAGRCERTGMLGAVVTSSSPAVAARCVYVRARVGAACTQNITDPTLGPTLLDRLEAGYTAQQAMSDVAAVADFADYRQLSVVDATGGAAVYSGESTLGRYTSHTGQGCVAAGNLLADHSVPEAMIREFAGNQDSHLGDRLIAALQAGLDAGGEQGPVHSCGLVLVDQVPWPVTDLRVDWSDNPIAELSALWDLWKPQADDYVVRALRPDTAPSYGVPGDE